MHSIFQMIYLNVQVSPEQKGYGTLWPLKLPQENRNQLDISWKLLLEYLSESNEQRRLDFGKNSIVSWFFSKLWKTRKVDQTKYGCTSSKNVKHFFLCFINSVGRGEGETFVRRFFSNNNINNDIDSNACSLLAHFHL